MEQWSAGVVLIEIILDFGLMILDSYLLTSDFYFLI